MSTSASGHQDAYIYDAVRTPFAKIGGALSGSKDADHLYSVSTWKSRDSRDYSLHLAPRSKSCGLTSPTRR